MYWKDKSKNREYGEHIIICMYRRVNVHTTCLHNISEKQQN